MVRKGVLAALAGASALVGVVASGGVAFADASGDASCEGIISSVLSPGYRDDLTLVTDGQTTSTVAHEKGPECAIITEGV